MIRWLVSLLFSLVVLFSGVAHAQTPCDGPLPGLFTVPSGAMTLSGYVNLDTHEAMELDGSTPQVASYQIAIFAEGADPNVAVPIASPTTVPRNAFTRVATSTCYFADLPAVPPLPGVRYVAALKAIGTPPRLNTAYGTISNPFASPSTALLAVPRGLRIRQK